jgi:hypothetical protein
MPECTKCGQEVSTYEVWDFWPEDQGHEACMLQLERAYAESLKDYPEGPQSLEAAYAEEGGPPYQRHESPHAAMQELAYEATSALILELQHQGEPYFPWPGDDPNYQEGTMHALVQGMRMAMDFAQREATRKSAEAMEAFMFFNLAPRPAMPGSEDPYGDGYREKLLWAKLGKRSQEILADRNPHLA